MAGFILLGIGFRPVFLLKSYGNTLPHWGSAKFRSVLNLRSSLTTQKRKLKEGSIIALTVFISKDLLSVDISDNWSELLFFD